MARTDKKKNVGKVAKVLADNPHATEREIAKAAGVSHGTAHNAKKELGQTGAKDPTIAYIVDASKERIKRAQRLFDRFLDESEDKDKLERKDAQLIKDLVKDDLQRVTIFGGNATDEGGGLNVISVDELMD